MPPIILLSKHENPHHRLHVNELVFKYSRTYQQTCEDKYYDYRKYLVILGCMSVNVD